MLRFVRMQYGKGGNKFFAEKAIKKMPAASNVRPVKSCQLIVERTLSIGGLIGGTSFFEARRA